MKSKKQAKQKNRLRKQVDWKALDIVHPDAAVCVAITSSDADER
jgi:hypothetical protein